MACCAAGPYVQVGVERGAGWATGDDVERTRLAMCRACPRRTRGAAGGGCEEWERHAVCPRGVAPGPTLAVRWRGRRWRGMPGPLRVWLAAATGDTAVDLPGCGCDIAAKRRLERVAAGGVDLPAWAAWVALGAGAVAAAWMAGA